MARKSKWNRDTDNPNGKRGVEVFRRDIRFAGLKTADAIQNCARIEACWDYNGSDKGAFGRAETWPVVDAHVPLPAGRLDLRRTLAERLRQTIDQFIEEHDLG